MIIKNYKDLNWVNKNINIINNFNKKSEAKLKHYKKEDLRVYNLILRKKIL